MNEWVNEFNWSAHVEVKHIDLWYMQIYQGVYSYTWNISRFIKSVKEFSHQPINEKVARPMQVQRYTTNFNNFDIKNRCDDGEINYGKPQVMSVWVSNEDQSKSVTKHDILEHYFYVINWALIPSWNCIELYKYDALS